MYECKTLARWLVLTGVLGPLGFEWRVPKLQRQPFVLSLHLGLSPVAWAIPLILILILLVIWTLASGLHEYPNLFSYSFYLPLEPTDRSTFLIHKCSLSYTGYTLHIMKTTGKALKTFPEGEGVCMCTCAYICI